MAETSQGGHSIKNDGTEKTSMNPATKRSGSNSPRVPTGTGPQAVSGGTTKTPD